MKRIHLVLFVAFSLVAGIGGGFIGNKISTPEPVNAQTVRAGRDIKIALVDLVKATRQSSLYNQRKLEFQTTVDGRKERMRAASAELDNLSAELEDMKRLNKEPDEIQRKELKVKAKQEEVKVIRDFCQQWLEELSNDFQKEVLQLVHEVVKDYCKRNGFDLVFQLYELDASANNKDDDQLATSRAWADTLKAMPVVYSQPILPKGAPNEYIKDITEDIINDVKNRPVPPPEKK